MHTVGSQEMIDLQYGDRRNSEMPDAPEEVSEADDEYSKAVILLNQNWFCHWMQTCSEEKLASYLQPEHIFREADLAMADSLVKAAKCPP